MTEEKVVRVLAVQASGPLRKAVEKALNKNGWIEWCGVTGVRSARASIQTHSPHVLIITISCGARTVPNTILRLKQEFPSLSVVVLARERQPDPRSWSKALQAGADGFLPMTAPPEEVIHAIRKVDDGERYFTGQDSIEPTPPAAGEQLLRDLSQREAEVFFLTGCGYVPRRIAERMDLSVKTVESYRERIRKKLGLKNGADLLYTATRFMRSAASRGIDGPDEQVIKELLSTIA